MRRIAAALLLVIAAALPACTSPPAPTAPTPSATTPVFPDTSQFTPAPHGIEDEDTGETHGPRPVPSWDASTHATVIAAAESAMTAYARPDLSFDEWWAGLHPLLDQTAAHDYAYIDPARIVAFTITGPGVITDDTSPYVAFVDVPTNAGTYRVVLSRADGGAAWKVSRFIVPEGVN